MSKLQLNILADLDEFSTNDLTRKIAIIEHEGLGLDEVSSHQFLNTVGAKKSALAAAAVLKKQSAQINVKIHALGILRCLPHILKKNEIVQSMSLGAGNTGKGFDLETNHRIAEFKFIHWKGGSEAIRQNGVFKDLFHLAEHKTEKQKYLYLLGTKQANKFLRGGRALDSVLSKNQKTRTMFYELYGERFSRVSEYFLYIEKNVEIVDVSPWLPELATVK